MTYGRGAGIGRGEGGGHWCYARRRRGPRRGVPELVRRVGVGRIGGKGPLQNELHQTSAL